MDNSLPWSINEARTADGTFMIVGGEGQHFGLIADVTTEELAAFIVKTGNSHDALVKALEEIATGCDDEHLHPFNSVWAELIKSRAREVLAKVPA